MGGDKSMLPLLSAGYSIYHTKAKPASDHCRLAGGDLWYYGADSHLNAHRIKSGRRIAIG